MESRRVRCADQTSGPRIGPHSGPYGAEQVTGAVDNTGAKMMKKKLKKNDRSSAESRTPSERRPPRPKPLKERASRFTPEALEKHRQALLEKRRELVEDVSSLQNEAKRMNSSGESTSSSSMPIHMADRGSDTWEQELTYRLLEHKEKVLSEIDDALQRIKSNTFGICQASKKRITQSRLRFIPWARYCIEYAWKGEITLA